MSALSKELSRRTRTQNDAWLVETATAVERERIASVISLFGADEDMNAESLFISTLLAQKQALGGGAIGMASAAIEAVKLEAIRAIGLTEETKR